MQFSALLPQPLFFDGLNLNLWHRPAVESKAKRVLFLHGYFDTGLSFESIIAKLDSNIACFALDFRGHGKSDPVGAGGSYHLLDYVKDAAAALKAIGPVDLVVAHSMGGNVAILLASALTEHIHSLLLLDSLGAPSEPAAVQPERLGRLLLHIDENKSPLAPISSLDEAIEKLLANNPMLSLEGAKRMIKGMVQQDKEGSWHFCFDPRIKGPVPLRFDEVAWREFMAHISAPTYLLLAEHGYIANDAKALDRLSYFKSAQHRILPNIGHHLHVEAHTEVTQAIDGILSGDGI